MLKIIQVGSAMPRSGPADSDPSVHFLPGMFGQVVNVDKVNWYVTVSDGQRPIGLIDDVRDGVDDTTIGSNRITLWTSPGIYAVDQFEKSEQYPDGKLLRVADNGQLTSRLIRGHCSVGQAVGVSGPGSNAIRSDGCVQFKLLSRRI